MLRVMPNPVDAPSDSSMLTKVLAVLLLLVAGALVFTVVKMRHQAPEVVYEPRAITLPEGDLGADEKATIAVFKQVSPSVVHITNIGAMRNVITSTVDEVPQGTGSGFVWDEHGHVVTNFHVVDGARSTEVTLSDGSTYEGKVIGTARDKDLAVLKIEAPPSKLSKIMVGTSADLQVGQTVFAIGNPFGLDQTLTTGVISGLGREITSKSQRKIYDVVQTDAPINPGNSGGPLLDSHGRLIGINTAIYSPSGASAGIGFAVPVDTINLIIPQILNLKGEVRPVLGVNLIADADMRQMGVTGVGIRNAARGGPADRAGVTGLIQGPQGLELGDVITKIDGTPVAKTSDLFKVLDRRRIGDTVDLEITRNGQRRSVKLTLEAAR
jgi:S1-C subfamily serine protease